MGLVEIRIHLQLADETATQQLTRCIAFATSSILPSAAIVMEWVASEAGEDRAVQMH